MRINKEKLLIAMARKKMTMKELSEKAKVSKNTLSKLNNKKEFNVGTSVVGKIAEALEVDVVFLIEDSSDVK